MNKSYIHKALLIILAMVIMPFGALAEPPLPPSDKERLESLREHLALQKETKKKLAHEARQLEKDVARTRNDLVDLAASIQKGERKLLDLENKIAALEDEQTALYKAMQKDRASLASIVLALQRLRRVPPQTLILKPDAPLKTAQTALLMEKIIPALYSRAEKVRVSLQRLDDISEDLYENKQDAQKYLADLQDKQEDMKGLLDERQKLFARTNKDIETHERATQKIATQARSLTDLFAKLEERRKQNQKQAALARKAKPSASQAVNIDQSIPDNPGKSRLPLRGEVRVGYNTPDTFGAPSQGIEIAGRAGALIIAPMNGTIRFAGHFKNYGNMVIVEHPGKMHSLIAGLEKIDTVVGQTISAGEPLGILHHSQNNADPHLYFELRKNGKPVDPLKALSNMS